MLAALRHDGPVLFLEHKLLSESWLEFLGSGGRKTVQFDIPASGIRAPVPNRWEPLEIGQAFVRRPGTDVTIVSLGVGVHRAIEAAVALESEGISAGVLDLRSVAPLDITTVCEIVSQTERLLVVDEDYERFGLSGELSAVVLEAGLRVRFARVCTRSTIPYARQLEEVTLPNRDRICEGVRGLMQ